MMSREVAQEARHHHLEFKEGEVSLAWPSHHAVEQFERSLHIPQLLCLRINALQMSMCSASNASPDHPQQHASIFPHCDMVAEGNRLHSVAPVDGIVLVRCASPDL